MPRLRQTCTVAGPFLFMALAACGGGVPTGTGGSVDPGPVTTPTSTGARPQPADVMASGLLGGNASPDIPAGEPGKVAVVVVGPVPTNQTKVYSIPIIVRNNTDRVVGRVEVTAAARDASGSRVTGLSRDADGKLANLGHSTGFEPALTRPGEVAFGALLYSKQAMPADATFEFTVETSEPGADPAYASVSLKVVEANLAGGHVVGTATNATGTPVVGPFEAQVLCFDSSGKVAATVVDFARPDKADVNGPAPFDVDVSAVPCTTFLVGVSSYFQLVPVTGPS